MLVYRATKVWFRQLKMIWLSKLDRRTLLFILQSRSYQYLTFKNYHNVAGENSFMFKPNFVKTKTRLKVVCTSRGSRSAAYEPRRFKNFKMDNLTH